jgi:uncharacterized protein (DUF983 family)
MSNPSPLSTALKGRCPRCGKGKLFSGWLTIAQKCNHCNLSLKAQDSGDGPVFFGLIIVGFLSIGFSGYIELKYEPVWWVHLLIFIPVTCILVLLTMRFFKAWLIALQLKVRPDTFSDL